MANASKAPSEQHAANRVGWLRAAVLGANDGILSVASLIAGVAAAASSKQQVLIAGTAALVAGALSMAAGEFVSVSSQADTEAADLAREKLEQQQAPAAELEELAGIYRERGLDADLARKVAEQLSAHDALGAHARDELGIAEITRARPLQAALTSAVTFSVGAALPLLAAFLLPLASIPIGASAASVIFLMVLGAVGAKAGGAPLLPGVVRVTFWGIAAMAFTYAIGHLFGTTVA